MLSCSESGDFMACQDICVKHIDKVGEIKLLGSARSSLRWELPRPHTKFRVSALQYAPQDARMRRFISQNSRAGFWGKDAIDTISRQLSREVPGLRGFSPRNLRNMRTFYEEWKCLDANLADASAKLDSEGKLAAYLRVLDDEERIEGENPSVGIVLCKDADRDEFRRRDDAMAFFVTH